MRNLHRTCLLATFSFFIFIGSAKAQGCPGGCPDTLLAFIQNTAEFCIDEAVIDFNGDITSTIFCAQGSPATVLGSMADGLCLDLVPANGFLGQSPDLLCVIHCFDNDPAMCDTTFIDVSVLAPLTPQTIQLTIECDSTGALCASAENLPGSLASITVCQPPANGVLASQNDTCFTYQPTPNFSGPDSACVVICDGFGICDTFLFDIFVEQCPQQFPCVDIPADTLYAMTGDCTEDAKFCIEFPLGEMLNYDFSVNGQAYGGNLSICSFDTILSYGFSAIPGNAMNGPYEIESWTVDGANIGGGTFADVFDLIDLMNMLDPAGNWSLDATTFNISSFNTASDYAQMTVTQQTTGDIAVLNINSATAPTGSALYLPVGTQEVTMVHQDYAFCMDTFTAIIHCSETEILFDTIAVGEMGSTCPEFSLPGELASFGIFCGSCENLNPVENGNCADYQGLATGTYSLALVACDVFGLCDTALLTVVVEGSSLPISNIDRWETNEGQRLELPVLDNDQINGSFKSLRILIDPVHGLATLNADQSITFSPDIGYCGIDAFAYELCNETGCDTSAVEIEIKCTRPVIHNGFSPNEDGINDFFKITQLEHFPKNKLSVFNRWGNLVFQRKAYANTWDGKDFSGADLPDGTYFYYLDLGNGQSMDGFVQIRR